MTVKDVFGLGLINDKTEIIIRDGGFPVFHGDPKHPGLSEYEKCKIDGFLYNVPGNLVRFDLK